MLVFLDFDGVINSGIFFAKNPKAQARRERDELVIDEVAMARLNKLLHRHKDARVVISSDWRKRYDHDILAIILHRNGFEHGHKVIGQTPNFGSRPRGLEIAAWLKARELRCPFVILDDRDDMHTLGRNLVQTDPVYGLTANDVRRASNILYG